MQLLHQDLLPLGEGKGLNLFSLICSQHFAVHTHQTAQQHSMRLEALKSSRAKSLAICTYPSWIKATVQSTASASYGDMLLQYLPWVFAKCPSPVAALVLHHVPTPERHARQAVKHDAGPRRALAPCLRQGTPGW